MFAYNNNNNNAALGRHCLFVSINFITFTWGEREWRRQREGTAAINWLDRREMMCLFYILGQMKGGVIAIGMANPLMSKNKLTCENTVDVSDMIISWCANSCRWSNLLYCATRLQVRVFKPLVQVKFDLRLIAKRSWDYGEEDPWTAISEENPFLSVRYCFWCSRSLSWIRVQPLLFHITLFGIDSTHPQVSSLTYTVQPLNLYLSIKYTLAQSQIAAG